MATHEDDTVKKGRHQDGLQNHASRKEPEQAFSPSPPFANENTSSVNENLSTLTHSFKGENRERFDKIHWETGDIIDGRYEVKNIVGQGGMGIVYRVYHREWDLELAVKMPLPRFVANEAMKARFIFEAQTWVNLGLHPNIVQCWYVREFAGIPRVFMDYMEGGSLKDWIQEGRVRPGEWRKIFHLIIQACDGLGYAHEHGVEVHRDVKPGNLLLTPEGELRVTDFGIAKRQEEPDIQGEKINLAPTGESQLTITITGSSLGTPEYSAPEQWGQARHADGRADVYALGVILFELCAGRRPFDDGSHLIPSQVLIGRHLFATPPDPREFNRNTPEALAQIIGQCLAKSPKDRPGSMFELRQKLVAVYEQMLGAPYPREIPQMIELRSDALNNLAVSLLDLGKKEEAFIAFDEALKLDPHHAESVYNHALLEWREESITDNEVIRRLKEAKQATWRAGLYLGYIHMERAAADQAEQELQEALNNARLAQNSSVWRALGDVRMAQEKYTAAETAYQKALQLMPGDMDILERKMLAQKRTRQHKGRVVFPWPHCLQTIPGYSAKFNAMMLTPDGRFAMLGNSDTMRLWDLARGKYLWSFTWAEARDLWIFKGFASSVSSVAVTSDGTRAVSSGTADPDVRLWDVSNGKCLRVFQGHTNSVNSVALSPDGGWALSGSADKTARLWDTASGKCVQILRGHRNELSSVAISPDGQWGGTGSADKIVRLWDLSSGKCRRILKGHHDDVTSVMFTPNGKFVASGSRDRTIRLWSLNSGRCVKTFTGHADHITALAAVPNSDILVSASRDKTVRVWNLSTGKCLRVLKGHWGTVTAVAATPDGRFILSGSRDKTMRLWRVTTGKCIRIFKVFTYWLEAIGVTSDSRYALLGNNDTFRLKDLATGKYVQEFKKYTGGENAVATSLDGRFAVLDSSEKHLWDFPIGEGILTLEEGADENLAVAATPDGRFAVSGTKDGTLRLWDLQQGSCLWTFPGSKKLLTLKENRNWVSCLVTTLDGRFAVSGWRYDSSVRLWDLSTGACLRVFEGHDDPVTALAVTSDGNFVLSGSADKTLRLWDLTTGECRKTFFGHRAGITTVTITADGRFALSGSQDKTVRLWAVFTGKCLRTFEGHDRPISVVAVTQDGHFAISGSTDNTLRLWLLDSEFQHYKAILQVCRQRDHQELQMLRERFRKNLTKAELAKKAGKASTAYTFLSLARALPGYERDPKALALTSALGRMLRRKSLRGGRLVQIIKGHKDFVTSVAVNQDGRFVLSGSRDRTTRFWVLSTGKCLRTFQEHKAQIACAALTPDRHFAVSGGYDDTLCLWTIATGECLKIFRGHKDHVKTVAITPDGYFAISGSADKTLRLWSLMKDNYIQIFDGLRLPLEDAYRSAELSTERCLRVFRGHLWDVNAVAVSPDGRYIVSGSQDKTLRLWSLTAGRCLRVFEGHQDYVTAVAITSDGRFALSGSRDKTLRLWSLKTGKCLRVFKGHRDYVTSVAVTNDRRFAISAGWDKTLRVWDLLRGGCLQIFEGHEDIIESVALSANGRFAISGSRDATIRVWEFDWGLAPVRH